MPDGYTPRIDLVYGQPVEIKGQRCIFVQRTRDGDAVFEHPETKRPEVLSDFDICRLIERDQFRLLHIRVPQSGEINPRTVAGLVVDPDSDAATQRNLKYVLAHERLGDPRTTDPVLDRAIAEANREVPDPKGPMSPSWLRKLIRRWRVSGRDPAALIPGIRQRGNRVRRLAPKVVDIIVEGLQDGWLTQEEPCVSDAHETIKRRINEHNEPLPPALRLKIPSIKTVHREIKRTFDKYTIMLRREGRSAVNSKLRPVGAGPMTEHVNEIWELDDTVAPVIVIDDVTDTPLGTPTFTVVIDRHSAFPPGWTISFDPPGLIPAFECLRQAVMPKTWMKDAYPDINVRINSFGVPFKLHTDNLPPYRSQHFIRGINLLGADVQYSPVRKPWYKGMVERFIQTACRQTFRRLPGTTFANIYKRQGKEPPEEVAVISLSELDMLFTRWLHEVYAERFHPGLGMSPRQAYETSVREHPLTPPPNPARLDAILAITLTRKPQKYGVEFEGLLYNSNELANMRIAPGAPDDVVVMVNPRNLGSIRVADPRTGEEIIVPAIRRDITEGLTLTQHRVAQRISKVRYEQFADAENEAERIARAHDFIREFGDAKLAAKGRKTEKRPYMQYLFPVSQRPLDAPAVTSGDNRPVSEVWFSDGTGHSQSPGLTPEPTGSAIPVGNEDGIAVPLPTDENTIDLDALADRLGISAGRLPTRRDDHGQE